MKLHTGGEKASSICNHAELMYEAYFEDLIAKSEESGLEYGTVWCLKGPVKKDKSGEHTDPVPTYEGNNEYLITTTPSPVKGSPRSIALPLPNCGSDEIIGVFHTHPGSDPDELQFSHVDNKNGLQYGRGIACIAAAKDGRRKVICDTYNTDHKDYPKYSRRAKAFDIEEYYRYVDRYLNQVEEGAKYAVLLTTYNRVIAHSNKMSWIVSDAINDGVMRRCSKESNLASSS